MKVKQITSLRRWLISLTTFAILCFIITLLFGPSYGDDAVYLSVGQLFIVRAMALVAIEKKNFLLVLVSIWFLVSPWVSSCFVLKNIRAYRWLMYPSLLFSLLFCFPISSITLLLDGITLTLAILVDKQMRKSEKKTGRQGTVLCVDKDTGDGSVVSKNDDK